MRVGFDLDGTLDKPAIALLANALLNAGHYVAIITSHFKEGGDWQSRISKRAKLNKLCIPFEENDYGWTCPTTKDRVAELFILDAVDHSFPLEYRLRDLGLRKGELSLRLDLDLFIDDSAHFCEVFSLMNGATTMLQVR